MNNAVTEQDMSKKLDATHLTLSDLARKKQGAVVCLLFINIVEANINKIGTSFTFGLFTSAMASRWNVV